MRYEDLNTMQATLSENVSEGLFNEIAHSDWRIYTSINYSYTESLIRRFCGAHARVPGLFTEEMMGNTPLQVFRWKQDRAIGKVLIEGALFLNGAVATVYAPGVTTHILFVKEETAQAWNYPAEPQPRE